MYLRFFGVFVLSVITTLCADAATLRKSSRLSKERTGVLDVVAVPTTKYVQNFFRGHCKNPDLNLKNIGKDKIPSEKYLFTAIDKINGSKASDGYAANAASDNIITMDYLYASVDKLKPSPDCCLLPWETDDVLSAKTDIQMGFSADVESTFPPLPAEWAATTFGDVDGVSMFVAISGGETESNVAAWSLDGVNWTETTMPVATYWQSVAYGEIDDKPMFVAIADSENNPEYNVAYSTDGKTWNPGSGLKQGVKWRSVTFGLKKFVAVAEDAAFVGVTNNGKKWFTNESNTMFTKRKWSSIAFGNASDNKERFVAVARNSNRAAYSMDGIDWKESKMPSEVVYDLIAVTYGINWDNQKGRFAAISGDGSDITLFTSDGHQWVKGGTLPVAANWRTVKYGDRHWIAMADNSDVVAYSRNGKTWTERETIIKRKWRSIAFGDDMFVAVANNANVIAYAGAETGWEYGWLGSTVAGSQVTSMAYGNGIYVALFQGAGSVAYSTDGKQWDLAELPVSAPWKSIVFENGRFVAVAGGDKESDVAMWSDDGISWELSSTMLPDSVNWQSVTYGDGKFVAVASGFDFVAFSYDGDAWDYDLLEPANAWKSVAYGQWTDENGALVKRFVTVNEDNASIAYSDNGINWTVVSNKMPGDGYWQSVAYGNGKFVAIAWGSNMIAYSSDGINWVSDSEYVLPDEAAWKTIVFKDDLFVAVAGEDGMRLNKLAYSYDGLNWFSVSVPWGQWAAVAIGNGQFVAIDAGSLKVATSVASPIYDTNQWSVTRTYVFDDTDIETVIISGDGICGAGAECSCKRTNLLIQGDFVPAPGQLLPIKRTFSDMDSCNLACAGICADNVINDTDGRQKNFLCGPNH